ncbi:ribosomal RNA-processing protein 8 isoform X4 [Aquila chrysaetos chrysaetos]|uniref:ribosomal RNA-processing protein 8 isoform X4 n=1 Tax=Aquila chrysaetos chrysaetos TaxID=223781 RepID=UPI00117675E5|nr:ribosomal RNA-processing protein 8 isoform X4 [Aquila chrysaetos chrysaetos]
MFAEEEWNDGAEGSARAQARAGPHGAPEGPGRPALAAAAGKRRRRLPGDCAAEAGRDGEPARKRPGERRQAAGRRAAAAEGRPAGSGEPQAEREPQRSGPRPDRDASAELPAERRRGSAEPGALRMGAAAGEMARRPSRRQRRSKRQQKKELPAGPGGEQGPGRQAAEVPGAPGPPGPEAVPAGRSAALRARMEERLLSARFRYINQQLYTSTSREAARLFQSDPEAFEIYHRGFAQQVGRWPENPVNRIIRYLRRRPASLVVADFGCGDCKIASSVRNKVHSFDLVALSPLVTVCDMAKVPLAAESVDIAVFCLALMGTNLQEILEEANRVLKQGGTLMVAEVASRFEDTRAFVNAMAQLGFKSVSKELKGFNSLDDLLHVKGITTRILELNSQRMTCRRRPSSEEAARVVAEEEDVLGPWEPERSGKGSPGSGPEADGSSGQRAQEPVSSTVCGEQEEEEEEEEEEEGSCYSEEGEDGSNVYFYYTIGERWIDYLQRTEDGGLLRHVRPKMKRKSENGLDGRALSPGKKLCKGSEYSRTLGPCMPSPTTTFGDLRNAKAGQARRRRIPSVAPPPELQDWLRTFQRWSGPEKLLALDELIDRCEPSQIKYMMQVIEPQFQRDFISLLPKELALYVLSFLEPRDLLRAAQTCRYWRVLAEDNLLWREKCREEGIEEPLNLRKRRLLSPGFMYSPWKFAFMRQHKIDMNWRSGELKAPKVLKGHDDHVITCLQFCGNRIVSGSDDNTLKVWSAVTGECVQTLVGHTGGVWSSQMRDSIVISGSTDRTLKVWNADTGECVHTLYGHTSTVRCMHLHGNRVVSGSRDATLRLWDIETGQCLHVLMGHVAAVRCVQYDGHKVVSGAYDYTVKVWDPESESCTHTLQGHTNRVYSLQFDGTHIVSGSLDTSIRVWDVESGNCLHTLMGHQSLTSGMELRDNILVSGNADSTVKIWDIKTGQCLQTLQGPSKHQSAVTCLQFSSKFVVTSSDDGTVKLWDLKTGEFVRNLVALESGGSGGVVWRIRASNTKLVCAVGSRNGTEETKLLVLDFDVDLK